MFIFAKRYLFAKKSHSVVNIIAIVSIFSIALPVAAVIILLSVFNGFGSLVETMNVAIDPEITVVPQEGVLFDVEEVDVDALRGIEGVDAVSFVAQQTMLIEHKGQQSVITLRGVDSCYVDVVPTFEQSIYAGEYRVQLGDLDRIVIGNALAYKLGVRGVLNTFMTVYSLRHNTFSSLLPMANYTKKRAKLSGVFRVDLESEERYAFTSLRMVQELMQAPDKATTLFVRVNPNANLAQVQSKIRGELGSDFKVQNRYELNSALYDIIAYEKWGIMLISILVMSLASFSLIGALVMLVIEKRENITTLRAMGASLDFVRRIFFGEGMLISVIAIGAGSMLGIGLTLLQYYFGFIKIPAVSFLIDRYPVDLQWLDVAMVVLIAGVISLVISQFVVRQMIKKEN